MDRRTTNSGGLVGAAVVVAILVNVVVMAREAALVAARCREVQENGGHLGMHTLVVIMSERRSSE